MSTGDAAAAREGGGAVPEPEYVQLLTPDGDIWRPEMGEQRICWISNEGIRISRVAERLKSAGILA